MTEAQLALDVESVPDPSGVRGQLRELPGTTWEDIFDMPGAPLEEWYDPRALVVLQADGDDG